jgi:hypothetical protein
VLNLLIAWIIFLLFGLLWVFVHVFLDSYPPTDPQFLRCNRSCQRYLFRTLWSAGFCPEAAYNLEKFEIDLAFPYSKIAIECGFHSWETTDILRATSRKKVRELNRLGWRVIRFSPGEIYQHPQACVQKVEEVMKKISYLV